MHRSHNWILASFKSNTSEGEYLVTPNTQIVLYSFKAFCKLCENPKSSIMPYELTFSQESMFWYLSLFAKASIFDKQDSKEMSPTLHTLYVTVGSYEEQLGILVVQEAWILHGILE